MPNWQKIADAIGQGLYGDEIQQFKVKKQAMQDASARLLLAQNEDTRAGAREGRAAEEDVYNTSQRGNREAAAAEALRGSKFGNERSQREADVFAAEGGVSGAAERAGEDEARKGRSEKRQDRELDLRKLSIDMQRAIRAQELSDKAKNQSRAAEDQQMQRGNQQASYDSAVDPLSDDIANIKRLQNIALNSSDTAERQTAEQELAGAIADVEKKRVIREAKRASVVGPIR